MDMKKILEASKQAIVIGIVLVVINFIFQLLGVFLRNGTIDMIGGAYSTLTLVLFFGLYAWAGMNAVKKHGMDLVGAGTVGAFAYLVTAVVSYVLNMIFLLLVWGRIGMTSPEPAAAAAFSATMAGFTGAMATVVSLAIVLCGIVVNFVVGAGGGAIANVTAGKKANLPAAKKKRK
jgi:hypothetical protein